MASTPDVPFNQILDLMRVSSQTLQKLVLRTKFGKEENELEKSEVPTIFPALVDMDLGPISVPHIQYIMTRFSFPLLETLRSPLKGEQLDTVNLLVKKSAPNLKTHKLEDSSLWG